MIFGLLHKATLRVGALGLSGQDLNFRPACSPDLPECFHFSSPLLFGPVARQAGLTCDTCHRQGDVNQAFYIPGLSTKPGNLDVTSHVFNPRADDAVANPVDIPSLRGIRSTGPYGRDGRTASLAAVGALGSGKSYFLKRLCWDTIARGGQVVTVDRTSRGEYAAFAAAWYWFATVL